ncbi:MAG TPA: tRNA threonylcarbamoyladenosine dehydratase [Treponemataceae bacterium]|nr:tRNA threonylcarbamoyladenosine dehydratase [Treponemataceae bacterium]
MQTVSSCSENEQFSRTSKLIGLENVQKLNNLTVVVFGLGGVGSYTVEALARAGVSSFILIDADTICESNINRQLIALHSTVGRAKVEAAKERILDINPGAKVTTHQLFYLPENADTVDLSGTTYIVDAVDTVTAKIQIIEKAHQLGVPVISSMGTGNKLDPSRFRITDIYKTSVCPLARVMRYELKKRNIPQCKVLFSTEQPVKIEPPPASISFVPSIAGLLIAREVILDSIS